jgi:hypothetical protein
MKVRFATALIAAAAFACGGPMTTGTADGGSGSSGSADGGAGSSGGRPSVVIVSPEDHHDFEFENEDDDHHGDDRFDLEVQIENAELAEPGQCRGRGGCGHLVLLIDGNACGSPNSSSSSHHVDGRFGKCVKVSGQHQIVVQLVDDAGNVLSSSGPLTVNVTLKGHRDGAGMDAGDDHGQHDGGDDHGDGGMGGDDDGGHH